MPLVDVKSAEKDLLPNNDGRRHHINDKLLSLTKWNVQQK